MSAAIGYARGVVRLARLIFINWRIRCARKAMAGTTGPLFRRRCTADIRVLERRSARLSS